MWSGGLWLILRFAPRTSTRLARWLPFRHHELIFLPLPGLRDFFLTLAEEDHPLALSLIQEASATLGQKHAARSALIELQALSLENAARKGHWAEAIALDLKFLAGNMATPELAAPFAAFQSAARDVHAAHLTTSYERQRKGLERARLTLQAFRTAFAGQKDPDEQQQRLQSTAHVWLNEIDEDLRKFSEKEQRHRRISTPFEPGSVLDTAIDKDHANLFKGRHDLIRVIDHDLADDRRAPLLLRGQRRMGKSSLLRMLPERLGTGTTVVTLNFQGLSGQRHRAEPHRWLAEEIAKARPELGTPLPDSTWGETLAWLQKAEGALGDTRLLVAIDEVERLQMGIEEGWTSAAFLDFVRAAGDGLRKIRVLLVSAHPPHRLGHAWTDRLINVVQRELTYLTPEQATDLAQNPEPRFPDIYPRGGVERIVRETNGHPYLVQLVCDELIRDLNGQGRLQATDKDLTRAFDAALNATSLFQELWTERTKDEQELLRTLASAGARRLKPTTVLKELRQQGYVAERDGVSAISVPLFGRWIRENA